MLPAAGAIRAGAKCIRKESSASGFKAYLRLKAQHKEDEIGKTSYRHAIGNSGRLLPGSTIFSAETTAAKLRGIRPPDSQEREQQPDYSDRLSGKLCPGTSVD